MSLGRRAAAVSAALDSRIWRQSFINAALEKAFAVVFQISLQRNYSDQHHILTVPDNPLSPNLFQTRVSIFSPKSTSAARIGSSVTLADCPPRQRSPRRKRLLWVCCYCYSERGYDFFSPSNVSSIMQICLFRCRGDHCKRLFLMSLSSRAKAFSRGEGGALPAMMLSSIESVRNSCGFVARKRRRQCDGRGQANLSSC